MSMAQRKPATTFPELFPLDDMYYTLELDYEDWEHEKNKKKQNKKTKKEARRSIQEDEEKKRRKGSSTSSRELRSLLPDVRPKKRGTSIYIYEGQEELYEGLENVLTKIKDYSEHSVVRYPFLTKVRMSDAPDYYKVIKKPMDLSVMTKKLKRGEYSSKSEFQADLNLIYANCRIYNTDPSSKIYLEHAECLEKRSKELMKPVRNIDFSKERRLSDANLNTSPLVTPNQEDDEPHTTPKTSLQSSNDSTISTPPIKSKQKSPDKEKEKFNNGPISPLKIEIPDLENENFQSKTDLYRCLTRQYRLQKLSHIHEQDKFPFGERDALVRDPNNMRRFMALNGYPGLPKKATAQSTTTEQTTNSDEVPPTNSSSIPLPPNPPTPTIISTTQTTSTTTTTEKGEEGGGEVETAEDVIARDVGFFPELCFFVDSVPELHLCISSDNEEEEQGGAGVPEAEGRGDVVEEAVASVVIKKEKEEVMQDEDERPRASKPNTPLTPSNSATSPPSSPLPVAAPVPSTARVHYAPLHCVEYYNALLRRTIALVLSKSGFVTIGSTQVMDVLTDVVNGYMLRLGRILKTHMDDVGGQVPMEEVFSRVLCEMGVSGLAGLREFVQNLYNPPDSDMDNIEYDPRNSLYNRSSMGGEYEYDEDGYGNDGEYYGHEYSEEELGAGTVLPENSGRQKRQVTKISERDNMYEFYEEEVQNADAIAAGAAPVYTQQPANSSSKIAKPKKILQKKSVKPQQNPKKRTKNLPPNVAVAKKKKQ